MRSLLFTMLLLVGFTANAGLYKWVDEEGNVHYSQKPPRDQEYKKLKAPKAAPAASSKPPALTLPGADASQKKPGGEAEALAKKNQQIRAENCEKAKKNLANYQIHRRIRDKDGNVSYVSDEDRANYIDNAKQAISNYCN